MNKKLNLIALLGITAAAAAAFTLGSQKQARATAGAPANSALTVPSCLVSFVQYSNDQLLIRCQNDPENYITWGPGWTACDGRQSEDTLKVFSSIAQSAMLSGKHLLLGGTESTTTCSNASAISMIRLF